MSDVLNLPLHDSDLLAEIEMATELMILAAESDGPLCQRRIDAVLQVQPPHQPPGRPPHRAS